ncbi:MAG: ABC transporter permease [Oscillospiraceae bacterium]|nr:ABC transporter permease [Oscillospiraceae bacterium]
MSFVAYLTSLNPLKLLGNLPGGVAQGLIWGIMALGVYITFRLLDVADLSVDGTFATGGAVTVMLILAGVPAPAAILIAVLSGILAGFVTGLLHTLLGIPAILAGILTQFALYSINLHIMGMAPNKAISVDKYSLIVSSRYIPLAIAVGAGFALVVIAVMYWYFGTEQGSAIRATGANLAMSKAQGININKMKVIALALSNGLVALSGGLMAQYQGFADINMGRGAIVIGLAAVIIGEVIVEALFKKRLNFAVRLGFVVLGGVIYYAVVVVVLWMKLNSNDLKLFTAVVVAIFLAVPYLKSKKKNSFAKIAKQNAKLRAAAGKGEKDA